MNQDRGHGDSKPTMNAWCLPCRYLNIGVQIILKLLEIILASFKVSHFESEM